MTEPTQSPRADAFATTITASRRTVVVRRGARLQVRATGKAMTEAEARAVSTSCLHNGEQLLDCIERDGTRALGYNFTFVVWPKTGTHTGRILADLRAAA